MSRRDWSKEVAESIPFDNDTNGFAADNVQDAIEEIEGSIKAGRVLGSSFSGTPKKYTVVFTSAYSTSNYAVTITGEDRRAWVIENKTASGFTINSSASASLISDVYWIASLYRD